MPLTTTPDERNHQLNTVPVEIGKDMGYRYGSFPFDRLSLTSDILELPYREFLGVAIEEPPKSINLVEDLL